MKDEILNPIESALESIEGSSPEIAKELFLADDDDIILKTDLKEPENICIVKLRFADKFLENCGIGSLFEPIILNLLFANVSLDRKSRDEFVRVNTSNLSNIQIPAEFDKIGESRK